MRNLTRETWQVIKLNIKNVLLFEVLFRLITFPIYLQMVSRGLKLALKAAGYSYVTAENIGAFLLKPGTLVYMLVVALTGLILMSVEIGALLTAFHGAAYSMQVSLPGMMIGGVMKLRDEIGRRNWQLLIVVLIDYVLTHLYLIYRVLAHTRPLNFVISGIWQEPLLRVLLVLLLCLFVLAAIPALFVFHGCMIEQKPFYSSLRRSMQLLRGHMGQTVGTMLVCNILVTGGMILVYMISVVITAVIVLMFAEKNLALAILTLVCGRVEMIIILIASIVLNLVNLGALTVQYYQYGSHLKHEPRWDFDFKGRRVWSRKMIAGVAGLAMAVSLFYIYDLVVNGFPLMNGLLSNVQITAHRGSSREAPENTMAAMMAAVDQLADYVELDVQETLDGALVLCHDSSLKRVAGVNRPVSALTLEQIRELDVGSWFSPEFEGEQIPTLEEVMEYCKGKLNLNIEVKYSGKDSLLPEKVAGLITDYEMEDQCVVSSVSLSYLKRIKDQNPDVRTGCIISAAYGNYYSSDATDFISIRSSFVNEKMIRAIHEEGKEVHAWTVNSKSELERMKMLGVDNVITDRPVLAREIIYRETTTETLLEYLRMMIKLK